MDRVEELATWSEPRHPPHRPPYMHVIPLAEAIGLAYGITTTASKGIQEKWDKLVAAFGTEIKILIDTDPAEIKKADAKVGDVVARFRTERISYVGGGGGKYGRPTLSGERDEYWGSGQKTLTDY
jgi:PHP family Zn ribbon phosphoesterase